MSGPEEVWDLAVLGSGPAGATAALGALRESPGLRVALLDAAEFPRDKACGDGVAPHVLDLLEDAGVPGLLADRVPVHTLELVRGGVGVVGRPRRAAYVVPRTVLDDRIREAALTAGSVPLRRRVRRLGRRHDGTFVVTTDRGPVLARRVVGADGANSVARRTLGLRRGPVALAVRGYAPVRPEHAGRQVIAFGTSRQPSYAWSFDRGDGHANVGYGELLVRGRRAPTRRELLDWLEVLLPGTTEGARDWRGHHLPLAVARPVTARGHVLLAGDAAGLVNPLTGEGLYYAVATGLLAGRHAAGAASPATAAHGYRRSVRRLLGTHLRHVTLAASLGRHGRVLDAGLRAAAGDPRVFDDLVELGLARGLLTSRTVRLLAGELGRDLLARGGAEHDATGPTDVSGTPTPLGRHAPHTEE